VRPVTLPSPLDLIDHASVGADVELAVTSPEGGRTVHLDEGVPVTVGREPPSSVCIPDPYISRVHARFTLLAGKRVLVEDLESRNGSWLEGQRFERTEVGVGSVVILAHAVTARVFELPGRPAKLRAPQNTMVGGPKLRAVLDVAARVAAAKLPVILFGETGTGKELLARFIHQESPRQGRPMVVVNCAAIPAQLVETLLFGHEKGAFTGAAAQHRGVFESAASGTVFLDEIGELPMAAQAALLRVVEQGQFTRVGGSREVSIDVRVVAATHRNLEQMCKEGTFRNDLFFRLSGLTVTLPPLRERPEDVETLAHAFLGATEGAARTISEHALARLRAYDWPGNVRELRNAVERAAVLAVGPVIEEGDLPARVVEHRVVNEDVRRYSIVAPILPDLPAVEGDLRRQLTDHQRRVVLAALEATGWNRAEAATRLGLPVRTLAHRMKVIGIRRPER